MDLFVGAGNSYSNCAWPTNPNVYEHFRLTYLKNIGTITNPIWQRIKHGHAEYPLGNVIFSSKYKSKAVEVPRNLFVPIENVARQHLQIEPQKS